MLSAELCTYEVSDGVATLGFNRPNNMNGMIGDMEVAYFEALARAEADNDVRVIVVTGHGRAFCPGADLAYQAGDQEEPLPNTKIDRTAPLDIAKPMIAAINGACAGVGLAYALQCDVRIAVSGAKMTTAFARRGLIAEYGMAWLLNDIAGRSVSLDLLLSGRVFTSDEAASLGVVNQVVDRDSFESVVASYAGDLAANVSPASMATIKRQVNQCAGTTAHQALGEAEELMRESLQGPDVAEGVASFLQRRPAHFQALGQGSRFAWMDEG